MGIYLVLERVSRINVLEILLYCPQKSAVNIVSEFSNDEDDGPQKICTPSSPSGNYALCNRLPQYPFDLYFYVLGKTQGTLVVYILILRRDSSI